jgi:serine/alanine adding enzyme
MQRFEIAELAPTGLHNEWQAYVNTAPNASAYHALEWRDVVQRTFGHRGWYLIARHGGSTRGVLPLIEMHSLLFGHFFVSMPFLDGGGIVADAPECETALALAAADLAEKRGALHIELRQSSAAESLTKAGWRLRQHKAALVIPLDAGLEMQWSGLTSRLRGKVRKAEKSGVTFSVGEAGALDDFYRVFCVNMRDLGTPVYSRTFFENILRLANDVSVLVAHREGLPVAGAIAIRHGQAVELPWICSDYSQSSFYGNECLYWNAIRWAYKSGARELNLGRCSIDAGTYRFKMQWNPQVHPLFWYYWTAPGCELPELHPSNPKYAFAIRCWKKMPVALANRVGPPIVRNIP